MSLDSIKKRINENKTFFYLTIAFIASFVIFILANSAWLDRLFYLPKFLPKYSKILFILIAALYIKQVFEMFIISNVKSNATYYLTAGVLFTFVAFYASYELFKPFLGLSTILFTVILGIPIIANLTKKEADFIKTKNIGFWKRHRPFINFYVFFMITILSRSSIEHTIEVKLGIPILEIPEGAVFSLEDLIEEEEVQPKQETSKKKSEMIDLSKLKINKMSEVKSIFKNNLKVMIIAWILSLFFGAGALFLITFNASIFASALVSVILIKVPRSGILYLYSFLACNMGIMFIHMIPEVSAYFVAAISGALLPAAFINDKLMSESFKKTIKESLILIVIAIAIVYISALIEVYVSMSLNKSNMCIEPMNYVNYGLIFIAIAVIIFEFFRQRRKKKLVVVDADAEVTEQTV